MLAVLLDPDHYHGDKVLPVLDLCRKAGADLILVGGSLLIYPGLHDFVALIKGRCSIPVLMFPGDPSQISPKADGILFLSLISGRNPDLLIGRHVQAAPLLRSTSLEVIPTGYMLIGNSVSTTAQYISHTFPIPPEKEDIAACTAMAGEMLGLQLIYLDAGSGNAERIPETLVSAVRKHIEVPLIVGGGITRPEEALRLARAGADIIVAGNIFEKNPDFIVSFAEVLQQFNP